ncbi:hypothetical protein [Limosilactobacillus antri]|uniref:hypothetical protein n=1 Tax=Limosilactobacillus antri TaxID=227943 RepID=UPI0011DCD82C|nr:hypothetical protein [Limosilactobacillus antri]
MQPAKLTSYHSSPVTGRSVQSDGLHGCNSSSVIGQARNCRRLPECPADDYCCPLHCPLVAVIVPVPAAVCQAHRQGSSAASPFELPTRT